MKNMNRNIRIFAENVAKGSGFNIYLDFSGQRELLMWHRHNGLLFKMLQDGACPDDVRRWLRGVGQTASGHSQKTSSKASQRLGNTARHLLNVIDDYMDERNIA